MAISFIITHFKDRLEAEEIGAQFIIVSELCSVQDLEDTWGSFQLPFTLANPQLHQLRSSHNACLSRAQLSYLIVRPKKTEHDPSAIEKSTKHNCTQSCSANAQVHVNYS